VKRVRGLDREFAKQSPETVFGHPSALVDEVSLTYGEKLATLERWRLNILSELSATSEGMASPDASGWLLKVLEEIEDTKTMLRRRRHANKVTLMADKTNTAGSISQISEMPVIGGARHLPIVHSPLTDRRTTPCQPTTP
jgi:hypothetical protein